MFFTYSILTLNRKIGSFDTYKTMVIASLMQMFTLANINCVHSVSIIDKELRNSWLVISYRWRAKCAMDLLQIQLGGTQSYFLNCRRIGPWELEPFIDMLSCSISVIFILFRFRNGLFKYL